MTLLVSPRRFGVRGFTLVEVALAIAVGLIVIAGAVIGYNVTKDSAANSTARERVNQASAFIAEYAAANSGNYPVSLPGGTGNFTNMWKRKQPDDYNSSPWGGQTGDPNGVVEMPPIVNGTLDPAVAPNHAADLTVDTSKAASLIYVSIQGNRFSNLQQFSNPTAVSAKGYAVSIYDRVGNPWFHLVTGK
jgi:prepilin-type N-terminal cleavage/methylation domain-containing protein